MSWATVVGLALAATSAAVSYDNTRKTEKRTDNALSESIRRQSRKQREADAKVDETVKGLEGSTAEGERSKRLDEYMQTLRTSRGNLTTGLTPAIGSSAFQADAANDSNDVMQYAGDTAGLMSRIDAAGLQRQAEGVSFGNLATDLNLIGREAKGLSFLDDLRIKRAAQRNSGKDFLASFLGSSGSAIGSSGAGSAAGGGGATGDVAFGYNSYGG